MKTFKKAFPPVLATLFLGMAILFSSCEKDLLNPDDDQVPVGLPGMYHRVIELRDGASSAKLGIASDDLHALDAFEASVQLKAVAEFTEESGQSESVPVPAELANPSEKGAVHICIIDEDLAPGKVGFSMTSKTVDETGKTGLYGYYSGLNYFYSYSANHYFKVTPINRKCVSAWLYQRGSTWTFCSWAGGSGGNYLCNNSWAASSTSTTLQYRLKAQGANYRVDWY